MKNKDYERLQLAYYTLYERCEKLQAENKELHQKVRYLELKDMYKGGFTHACPDVIFPNTDERGLGEGDTPSDLSPLDL